MLAPGAASASGEGRPWTLLSVAQDRRSIQIGAGYANSCGPSHVAEVARHSSRSIELRVVPPPTDQFTGQCVAMTQALKLTVQLPWRLAGQEILGPDRTLLVSQWDEWNWYLGRRSQPDATTRQEAKVIVPGMTGLRVSDALGLARGMGIRRRDVLIKGPESGYVVKQTPSVSVAKLEGLKLRLTTKALLGNR